MKKTARSRSADPVQEALREAKDKWNKSTSAFISDVINLKWLMNGRPSKFESQKSRIQDPLPEKATSALALLSLEFKDLAQSGHDIIQKQLDYSKNRKKKTVMNTNNIVASLENLNLYSEGSNPLSRFITRLTPSFLGGTEASRKKKYRVSLLSACADIYRDVLDFQEEIVKSSPDSIFTSSKLWTKIQKRWVFVDQTIANLPEFLKPADSKNEVEKQKETKELDISDIIDDASKNLVNFLNLNTKKIDNLIFRYKKPTGEDNLENLTKEIKEEYNKLLSETNEKNKTSAKSFKELTVMGKFAENVVNKWLGKAKHVINPFDKTSAARLDLYNNCKPILKSLDVFMDSLEKELNILFLNKISTDLKKLLIDNQSRISQLEKTLDGKGFEDKFIKMLDNGDISEYDSDMTDKQKERLKRMIEMRRFRDLSNFYKGQK